MKRHHREESSSRTKKSRAPSVSDEDDNNGYVSSSKKHKSPPRKALLRRPSREERSSDKRDHGSRQTFLLRSNPPTNFVSGSSSSRPFNSISGHSSSRKSYAPSSGRISNHSSRSLINSSSRVNPMLAASLASSGKLPNLPIPPGSSGGSAATVAAVAAAAMNAAAMAAALGAGGVISSKQMSHITKALATATRSSRDRHGSTTSRPVRNSSDKYVSDDSRSGRRAKGDSREKDMLSIFNARYSRPVEHRNPEDDPNATRTLFLGNLPPDVEEPELRKMFERYGIIEDIDIKRRELETGATAFAFVRYLSLDMAHRAKVNLSGQMIGEYRFKIGYGKVIPTRCLWIGGLGPWTNYPEFATLVNSISSPEKIIWPSGKNYAHILYANSELAAVAADLLRGYPLGNSHRRIRVDFTDESHMFKDPNWKRLKRNSSTESNSRHYSSRRSPTPRTKREASHSDVYSRENNHYSKYKRDRRTYDDSDRSHSVSSNRKRESVHKSRRATQATHERASRRSYRDHSLSQGDDSSRCVSRSPTSSRSRRCSSTPSTPPTLETSKNIGQLASCLPKAWDGAFYLKSSSFQCRMHVLRGDKNLVDQFMYRGLNSEACVDSNGNRRNTKKSNKNKHGSLDDIDSSESQDDAHDGVGSDGTSKDKVVCLRITQRMRLDPVKLDDVNQRVKTVGPNGFCALLAVPTHSVSCNELGDNDKQPQRPLRNLVAYLRTKDSAGVVLLNPAGHNQNDTASPSTTEATCTSGVLYAFPPCDFSLRLLRESAPQLEKDYCKDDHLVILLIRGTGVV